MENKQKTQLEQANEALTDLAVNVTTSDRQMVDFSEYTVIQYLKGRGKDLDTAMELLEFFRKRIAERSKAIA